MKPCLVDVNMLIPLLAGNHRHHGNALAWFRGLAVREAILCRQVQLSVVRLLCNPSVMGADVISASEAWNTLQELLNDERLAFMHEPESIDLVLPALLRYPGPSHKIVSDAYLAAFAIAASVRLTTFDSGFREFRGLDLNLLAT